MDFSNKFTEKSNLQLCKEAVVFWKKNILKIVFYFSLPFTLINIIPIATSISLSDLRETIKTKPFSIFMTTEMQKKTITPDTKKTATQFKPNWHRLEKLPRKNKLTIIIKEKNGKTKYYIDSKKNKSIWIHKNKILYTPPAIFFHKPFQMVSPLVTIPLFILTILLSLFLLCWILLDYFNKPPIRFREILELSKNNAINFIGTYALLLLLAFILPAMIHPLLIPIAIYIILVKFSLAPCATITEGLKPLAAIKRATYLTQGYVLRCILFAVAVTIMFIITYSASLNLSALLMGKSSTEIAQNLTATNKSIHFFWPKASLLTSAVLSFISSLLLPVIFHYLYNLYMDFRIRKENLHNKSKRGFFEKQAEIKKETSIM